MNTPRESPQATNRTTAVIVGVLYITGTVAGVLSMPVMGAILGTPDDLRIVSAHSSQIAVGALLMVVMGISLAMVPALMFPILKRWNEPLAIGYVIFRGALEVGSYLALALSWLFLNVVARQSIDAGAAVASQVGSLGLLLVNVQEPIIAVGDIVFGLGALMLYSVLYQARLIPRWISGWGLIAAVAYVAAGLTAMFARTLDSLLMPMLVQEMVMAVWLIVKGFNASPIASGSATAAPSKPLRAA